MKYINLNHQEKQILENFENDELISVTQANKKQYQEYAKGNIK